MKKYLIIALAVLMLAGLIVACDSSVNDEIFGSTLPNYLDFEGLTDWELYPEGLAYLKGQKRLYFKADNTKIYHYWDSDGITLYDKNGKETGYSLYFNLISHVLQPSYIIEPYQYELTLKKDNYDLGFVVDFETVGNIFTTTTDTATVPANSDITFTDSISGTVKMHVGSNGTSFAIENNSMPPI